MNAPLLSTLLDYESTLEAFAELCVPAIADLCIFDLLKEDGSFRRIAYSREPEKEEVRWFFHEHRPNPAARTGVYYILRSRQTVCDKEIDLPLLQRSSRDEKELELYLKLELKSRIAIPLQAQGEQFGVLTLFTSTSNRHYTDDDVVKAEALANHISLGLYNSSMFQRLHKAVELRDEFLSIASHELKTPLTSLLLRLGLLKKRLEKFGFHQDVIEDAKSCELITLRANTLIENLLDVTRMEFDLLKLDYQVFDISKLLKEVISIFDYRPGIQMEWLNPPQAKFDHAMDCVADRNNIGQVLTNLISNAIRYGKNTPILVRVEALPLSFRIEVIDKGLGIPEDKMKNIFDRFSRVINPDSKVKTPGLGLGLYISERIMEKHGSKIHVASKVGEGSTFWIEIPTPAGK